MKKKNKCHECGCPAFELVSSKEKEKINVVCFHCGTIIRTYDKDEFDDKHIKIRED
jgi:transcription initiation factor TFIIIB Brf1 subunit/transcription initiation factor TFIIB